MKSTREEHFARVLLFFWEIIFYLRLLNREAMDDTATYPPEDRLFDFRCMNTMSAQISQLSERDGWFLPKRFRNVAEEVTP